MKLIDKKGRIVFEDEFATYKETLENGLRQKKYIDLKCPYSDFSGANFRECHLYGELHYGTFDDADFYNACVYTKMKSSSFKRVNFERAEINNCQMPRSIITSSKFFKTSARYCDFTGSAIANVRFESTNLRDSKFNDATLTDVHFNDVNLTGAGFHMATLLNVTFTNVVLSENPVKLEAEIMAYRNENPFVQVLKERLADITGTPLHDLEVWLALKR